MLIYWDNNTRCYVDFSMLYEAFKSLCFCYISILNEVIFYMCTEIDISLRAAEMIYREVFVVYNLEFD